MNSKSEMFGWKCNFLSPVFFVVCKAVVKVSRIDVLEPRAFIKEVAEIDSRDVKSGSFLVSTIVPHMVENPLALPAAVTPS